MKYGIFYIIILLYACKEDNKTLKIKGSDTEVNLVVKLAESYHDINPNIFVSISGGGSGLGIASLINNTADLANSSRNINDGEIELFKKKGEQVGSFIFAQDAIAFIVADDLQIDSISTDELKSILGGRLTDWEILTGKNMKINIYGRQSNSGTYDFVKDRLGIEFTPYAKQMNGNAQILEAIKADHSGIGYVGAGYVKRGINKGFKVLPVYPSKQEQAVSPLDSSMIARGKYFFQRNLYQYYKVKSYERIRPFLEFEKSEAGKKIISASGYYPIN